MNKDFIKRIINVSEIAGYILGVYLFNCGECDSSNSIDSGDEFMIFILLVTLARIGLNYIFQIKLYEIIIVSLCRKILKNKKLAELISRITG